MREQLDVVCILSDVVIVRNRKQGLEVDDLRVEDIGHGEQDCRFDVGLQLGAVTRNLLHEFVLLHVGWRRVEQQVLRLDVAVDQVVLAQVLEGAGDLLEELALGYLSKISRVSGSPAMRALPFVNATRFDI
jgi:hypothetical protein